jgi:predicted alpha-1,2-mannosidase
MQHLAVMRSILIPLIYLSLSTTLTCAGQQVADLVNPLVGTAAEGQTFPIAGVPFAMTDWTPQTRDGETKCVAPYYFADTRIQGFRGSHFLSGSCTQDYGSFTVMPVSGKLKLDAVARASSFSRAEETARPYKYSVRLSDYDILAEMTGTLRCGLMRFQYKRPGAAWLVLQNNRRPGVTQSQISLDAAHNEVTGWNAVYRIYAGNGKPAGFKGYFVMQFDRPVRTNGRWDAGSRSVRTVAATGQRDLYVGFDLKPGEAVQVRVGTSFSSVEEARRNLDAEIPDWDFDKVAAAARSEWERALGAIQIAGKAPERRIFYTALYHSLLLPRTFSDGDGAYPRFAGGGSIETAKGFTYYDDFSIWDTFRALHPLLTILDPKREGDMVQSLVEDGTQGGFLPIYPAWNSYTSEMIGDHADAIIVDAYAKGIRNFDVQQAYRLMRRNAMESPSQEDYVDGRGRRALVSYLKYGYIPLEDKVPFSFHQEEQVSRTLEYAYDDYLVGTMAGALGANADAETFLKRSENWRNVIDKESGFARGRHADGTWITPFDPSKAASYITEGLPFQYTFFVPQNIPALIDVLGGKQVFVAKLDELFSRKLYDQGNEPSHHIAYLYNAADAPAKTQQRVRGILDSQYADRPDGLSGNDDCGQMSAWYVLSALGFYPVTPGIPEYQIGTPRFDDVTVKLPGGNSLHVVAQGAEGGKFYIRSVRLNGVKLDRFRVLQSELMGGGELVFEMTDLPPTGGAFGAGSPIRPGTGEEPSLTSSYVASFTLSSL